MYWKAAMRSPRSLPFSRPNKEIESEPQRGKTVNKALKIPRMPVAVSLHLVTPALVLGGRKNCERASERLTMLYLMPKEIQRLFCLIWITGRSAFDLAGTPAGRLFAWPGPPGQPAIGLAGFLDGQPAFFLVVSPRLAGRWPGRGSQAGCKTCDLPW